MTEDQLHVAKDFERSTCHGPIDDVAVSADTVKPGITFAPETTSKDKPAQPTRAKPAKPWDTLYRAGEPNLDTDAVGETRWPPQHLHPELMKFNISSLEDGMRRIVSTNDEWKLDYLADPCVDLASHRPNIVPLHPADVWWSSEIPAMSADLNPFVKRVYDATGSYSNL